MRWKKEKGMLGERYTSGDYEIIYSLYHKSYMIFSKNKTTPAPNLKAAKKIAREWERERK